MANWYGTSITNYFEVEDLEVFKKAMEIFEVEVSERDGRVTLRSTADDGDWPSAMFNGDGELQEEIWFPQLVSKYLARQSVAVFQTIGAEKTRYLTGVSTAINRKGEFVNVSIDDIYKKAKRLGHVVGP